MRQGWVKKIMFKLKRYLRKYKKESVIAPMFKMLEACFELLTPLVMARIVDVGIRDRDMGYIMMMCAVMVALGCLGCCAQLRRSILRQKQQRVLGRRFGRICFGMLTVFLIRSWT